MEVCLVVDFKLPAPQLRLAVAVLQRSRKGRDGAAILRQVRRRQLARVVVEVCNSDAFRVGETDSATNRERIAVLRLHSCGFGMPGCHCATSGFGVKESSTIGLTPTDSMKSYAEKASQ